MDESDRPRRRSERRTPVHRVIFSAEAEYGRTKGEAVNLSDGGACLALADRAFEVGDELILWMHFEQTSQPVTATGRVVWTAPEPEQPRCGVAWTHQGPQRRWISWLVGA